MSRAEPLPFNMACVRAFDIRGVVGRDLNEGDARLLGGAYASLAREQGLVRIAVCRDGRLTSPSLEAALLDGLVTGGMDVTRLGVGPTPMLAFAVRTLGLDGGIMVTASHNPPPENGFKSLLGQSRIHGAELRQLVQRRASAAPGGRIRELSILEPYVAELASVAPELASMRIVWDCSNGATGEVIQRLVARLPGQHILLNETIDGTFPGHPADPAVEANMRELQRAVVENACDLGIAFDGDGDRIGAVDSAGAMVWADQLLLLLASDVLLDRPGATIVADVKCSSVLFEGISALGGRAVMVPSGYVLVRDAMRAEGAVLGGELSGHVFYNDRWDGTDDAVYVALRLLQALTRSGRSLASFRASLPHTFLTPELRLPCSGDRGAIVAAVGDRLIDRGLEVDRSDGLRVNVEDGWWLLRASGTESKLTVRCEAHTAEGLERLMQQVRQELRASGIELG